MSGLRSVHPVEAKEITPFGAWLLTRALIGASGLLFIPFVVFFAQHG